MKAFSIFILIFLPTQTLFLYAQAKDMLLIAPIHIEASMVVFEGNKLNNEDDISTYPTSSEGIQVGTVYPNRDSSSFLSLVLKCSTLRTKYTTYSHVKEFKFILFNAHLVSRTCFFKPKNLSPYYLTEFGLPVCSEHIISSPISKPQEVQHNLSYSVGFSLSVGIGLVYKFNDCIFFIEYCPQVSGLVTGSNKAIAYSMFSTGLFLPLY